jgi:outer membrane protein assembly factor BamB
LGAVAVAGDQLVAACADGGVYVLDRQGRLLRKWDSRSPIVAAPCVTDRFVYVVNQDGLLHALDRQWLQPVWETRLGQPGRYFSSPVVARGRVLIGTELDGLRCVGEPGPENSHAIWPAELGGPGAAGCRDGSHVPPEAEVLWEWSRLPEVGPPLTITAPAAAAGDAIVVAYAAGDEFGVACLEAGLREPRLRWSQRLPQAISPSPSIVDCAVIAPTGPAEAGQRQMSVFDLETGKRLWSMPDAGSHAAVLTATSNRVFVREAEDALACRTIDGLLIWTQRVGRLSHEVDVSGDLVIGASASPPMLCALDGPTGRRLWTCALEHPASTAPAVRGNRICLSDETGVQARSLVDGRLLWQSPGKVSGPLYVDQDRFAYVSAAGEVVLGDAATGLIAARLAGAVRGTNPLVAGNGVLWRGPGGILSADLQGQNVHPFAAWGPEAITAAPILHASRIYVGIAGRGLVCLGKDGGP